MYLAIQARDRAGNWSRVEHYPFYIDNIAPVTGEPTPPRGAKMATETVQIPFLSGAENGIDPEAIRFQVNGKSYPAAKFLTQFDPDKKVLQWNWTLGTGLFSTVVPDGTQVRFGVQGLKDFAGNEGVSRAWTYLIDYASDRSGPTAPELSANTKATLQYDTFTYDTGGWTPYYGLRGSRVLRVLDPLKRDYVARVVLGSGGTYGLYLRSAGYDPAQYPWISFDYRIPAGVPVYLHVYATGGWRSVTITGKSRSYSALGAVPGIKADDQWHTAVFNLYDWLKKAQPKSNKLVVHYIVLSNMGAARKSLYLDNFQIFGPTQAPPTFQWRAADPTGIRGYSTLLTRNPAEPTRESVDTRTTQKKLSKLSSGLYHFKVKAQDGAGHWGGESRYTLFVP